MSNYKRATFEEEDGSDIPTDGAISPDSVEVGVGQRLYLTLIQCRRYLKYTKENCNDTSN